MSVMKAKEIMEVIPHRQPMLLIDTIEELTPGRAWNWQEVCQLQRTLFCRSFSTGTSYAWCTDD